MSANRERGHFNPSIDQMFPEGKRHVYGYVRKKDDESTINIDDYRYRGEGKVIEVIKAHTHEVVAIPTENVSEIREVHQWQDGYERRFPRPQQ